MNITGAELIIRFLESRPSGQHGAVAVVPGGKALHVLERALADSTLPCRQDGDAAILFFDYATGLSSAAGVLSRAKAQRRPMVGIAVQVRRSLIGTDACRPQETRCIFDSLTRSWFHIGAAMELLELLPAAFRIAASGQRGPVLLEIPEDVLTEVIQGAWIPGPRTRAVKVCA